MAGFFNLGESLAPSKPPMDKPAMKAASMVESAYVEEPMTVDRLLVQTTS
jgi:hypothetical protein